MSSVFDRKGPLSEGRQEWMRNTFKDAAGQEMNERFIEQDREDAPAAYEALERAFEAFLQEAILAGGSRTPFTQEQKDRHIQALARAIGSYESAVRAADAGRLQTYEEEIPEIEEDPVEFLRRELAEETDSDRRGFLQDMLVQQLRVGPMIRSTKPRSHERTAEETAQERAQRAKEVESLRAMQEKPMDAYKVARRVVNAYGKELAAHQVILGLEARYSDAEILAQLESTFDPEEIAHLRVELPELREERAKKKGDPATDIFLYGRVMQAVFGDHKIAAGGFTLGSIAIGAMAPLMPGGLAEFGRTGNRMDAVEGAGAGMIAALAEVELNRALQHFFAGRLHGEGGISQSITKSILGTSPELFLANDKMFLQKQIEYSLDRIEAIAKMSVQDVGIHATRLLALGSAIALRLGDPRLFLPITVAIGTNLYFGARRSKEMSPQDLALREAGAEYMSVLDKAMEARSGRESIGGPGELVFRRIEEARKRFADTYAAFERKDVLIMPAVLFSNAMLINTSSSDFLSNYLEVSVNGVTMVNEFQQLTRIYSEMGRALEPVRELMDLVNEFSDQEGYEPERWNVEMHDYTYKRRTKKRGEAFEIHVPKLDLPQGTLAVVVGESGAGKSTLLEALYGFSPERGIQTVDGIFMSEVNRRTYREKIAVSNQFYAFEAISLRETVTAGDIPYNATIFAEVAQEWGVDKMLARWAQEKERPSEHPEEQLRFHKDINPSGGQKKLLSLFVIDYRLRVAPDSVKMILLDEPVSGVDVLHIDFVAEKIRSWHKDYPQKTIVLVEHNPNLFRYLPNEARILGFDVETSTLVQDETLATAKTHIGMPYTKLFGHA